MAPSAGTAASDNTIRRESKEMPTGIPEGNSEYKAKFIELKLRIVRGEYPNRKRKLAHTLFKEIDGL